MPFAYGFHPWTREGIEWLNPGQTGVYGIANANSWIYVGKGDIRDRLLAHLNRDNSCITRNGPTRWTTEVWPNPDARERQLILELRPNCNHRAG